MRNYKIGFELNHVLRDINKQVLKYYVKDFDPSFDEDKVNLKDTRHFFENFDFGGEKSLRKFLYIDYPYEIFGCANTMEKQLSDKFTVWVQDLADREDMGLDVCMFSLGEEALTIQSSYFFLSKIGCRARETHFPKTNDEVYDKFDIIVTSDEVLANGTPEGKMAVLITNGQDMEAENSRVILYESLVEMIEDKDFFKKVEKYG